MRLRDIPTDFKISAWFIAVFLLALAPIIAVWLPDVWVAIKIVQDEKKQTAAKRAGGAG